MYIYIYIAIAELKTDISIWYYHTYYIPILSGWWYTYSSEKYEFVSWDDDIPNWMESHKVPWFQTTNQICAEISIKLAKD